MVSSLSRKAKNFEEANRYLGNINIIASAFFISARIWFRSSVKTQSSCTHFSQRTQNSIFLPASWIILNLELVESRIDLANAQQLPFFLWEPTIAKSFVFIDIIKPIFIKVFFCINWRLKRMRRKAK